MADEKEAGKSPDDVSGMSATERYEKVQADHVARQRKTVTPHDLRVEELKHREREAKKHG